MVKQGLVFELENNKTQKVIMKYALPAIISGIIAAFYNIIDQIFIGNIVGTAGNAATNVAFPLVTMQTALMLFFGLGGAANFSIVLGRKDIAKAKKFMGVTLLVTPVVGILLTVITLVFSSELLWLFGATQTNYELAKTYIGITAFGFPLYMTTEAFTKIIRSDGSPKYAMVCSMTGAILNCFLNPFFMIVFDMGIAGAAYATVLGQSVSFVLTISYLFRFKTFKFKFSEIIPNRFVIKMTMILGMASFLNQIVMMIAQIVMNNVFSYYGALSVYGADIPLACVGIIAKVTAIYMAVMIGIAQGAQPLFGYCYGARKIDKITEIYKICAKLACVISLCVFVIFQVFPSQILSLFGAQGDLYIEFGVMYFRIFMLMTFLNGIQPITFNFFTAIGKPIRSIIVSLSKQLAFFIPLVVILPMIWGLKGALFAGPIGDVLALSISMTFLRIEMKNLKKISNENKT